MTNDLKSTVLFKKNYAATAHIVVNQGGTSSGKTYAILQVLFCLGFKNQKQVITVVSQDIPNLKAGALRDALNIYEGSEPIKAMIKSYNRSDRIFEYHNGTIVSSCVCLFIFIDSIKPLKNNFFSSLGDYSYSMYLIHVPIGIYLLGFIKNIKIVQANIALNIIVDLSLLALIIFISRFTFELVELKSIGIGKRLSK